MDLLNNLITTRLNQMPRIKRIIGVVKKVVEDTDSAKVKVKIRDINNEDYIKPDEVDGESEQDEQEDPDEKHWLTLLNKSKDKLEVGDCVWVHYWNTISDGYVAIKIGLSKFKTSSAIVIVRPLHSKTKVGDSYSFYKKTITHNKTYTYSTNSGIEQGNFVIPQIQNIRSGGVSPQGNSIEFSTAIFQGGSYNTITGVPQRWNEQGIDDIEDYLYNSLTIAAVNPSDHSTYTLSCGIETSANKIEFVYTDQTGRHTYILQEIDETTTDIYTYMLTIRNVVSISYDSIADKYCGNDNSGLVRIDVVFNKGTGWLSGDGHRGYPGTGCAAIIATNSTEYNYSTEVIQNESL